MIDSNYRVRVHGFHLYAKSSDKPEKVESLVKGLFNINGYVCKAAGNELVKVGHEAMPYIELILASGREGQKFFARQIKVQIERRSEVD